MPPGTAGVQEPFRSEVDIDKRQQEVMERIQYSPIITHADQFLTFPKFGGFTPPRQKEMIGFTIGKEFDPSETPFVAAIPPGPGILTQESLGERIEEPEIRPEDISRSDVFESVVNLDEHDPTTQKAVCERVLDIYTNVNIEELSPQEVLNIGKVAECMDETEAEKYVKQYEDIIDKYFKRIEEHPIISMRTGDALEEPLTFRQAKEVLENRKEKLRETSEEVFEEIDDDTIGDLQRAYLLLIWDDIIFH